MAIQNNSNGWSNNPEDWIDQEGRPYAPWWRKAGDKRNRSAADVAANFDGDLSTSEGMAEFMQQFMQMMARQGGKGQAETWYSNLMDLLSSQRAEAYQKEQSELAYQRSLPTTQLSQLMSTGMSRDAALQAISGAQYQPPSGVTSDTVPDAGQSEQLGLQAASTAASFIPYVGGAISTGLQIAKQKRELDGDTLAQPVLSKVWEFAQSHPDAPPQAFLNTQSFMQYAPSNPDAQAIVDSDEWKAMQGNIYAVRAFDASFSATVSPRAFGILRYQQEALTTLSKSYANTLMRPQVIASHLKLLFDTRNNSASSGNSSIYLQDTLDANGNYVPILNSYSNDGDFVSTPLEESGDLFNFARAVGWTDGSGGFDLNKCCQLLAKVGYSSNGDLFTLMNSSDPSLIYHMFQAQDVKARAEIAAGLMQIIVSNSQQDFWSTTEFQDLLAATSTFNQFGIDPQKAAESLLSCVGELFKSLLSFIPKKKLPQTTETFTDTTSGHSHSISIKK